MYRKVHGYSREILPCNGTTMTTIKDATCNVGDIFQARGTHIRHVIRASYGLDSSNTTSR